jgi:hypothetical protein
MITQTFEVANPTGFHVRPMKNVRSGRQPISLRHQRDS